jgi:pyruvate dehydrogenase E2 component (dihydrolipoamide acetyltransferase)
MLKEIRVPDIGAAKNVDVIEVLVKAGDKIAKEAPLVTLESDKASMEIPSSEGGVIKEVKMKVGDKVSEGDLIVMLEITDEKSVKAEEKPAPAKASAPQAPATPAATPVASASSHSEEVYVPDIGAASKVDVIEVMVKPGDKIAKDAPLITLESDKASMEIPSPKAGTVEAIKVKLGDKVSKGDLILTLMTTGTSQAAASSPSTTATVAAEKSVAVSSETAKPVAESPVVLSGEVHASPAVRRLAREFGVDLNKITASGPKKRVLKEDVQNYVKTALSGAGSAGTGLSLAPAPQIDFAKFGEIEIKPLNKIKKLTGVNLHRNWVTIPHVTQFGEADITELETFREEQKSTAEKKGYKLTPLVFIMKAVVAALKAMPQFNSSLDSSGENLVMKKYFHLGVAVDTPNGLVVPVIRDVDKKGLGELAQELAQISQKAREKGLSPLDMQGSSFTISSLGGIGGTAFTPIVNAPDVAILGVSKASMKPIYENGEFLPRLMLPLSLSYDHRVIDGADGARFIVYLSSYLSDIRTLLL